MAARTEPEDVTQHQYQQAWELYRTGATPRQICEVVGLTHRQLHWLHRTGNLAKGMTPFEAALTEEIKAIRSCRIAAASTVSKEGVEVLRQVLANAKSATLLVSAIFQHAIESVQDNARRALDDPERTSLAACLPQGVELDALKVLRRYCDLTSVASAYKAIYENPNSERASSPAGLPAASLDLGEPGLPAALVLLDEHQAATGGSSALLDSVMREMAGWTIEQQLHYAETGEEPTPQDVMDAEVTTH